MPNRLDADTQPVPAQPEQQGWVLGGRYRVVDRLGAGGMAEVFRAHDELLDRDVAVKVFRTVVDDADENGELRRELELQSLAHLSHPNLITLFDASLSGDGPGYLVLEYVPGPDLATRLREGPLPEPEARQIGAQLADALAYVHARGLVHRDVKPGNILLGDDGVPGTVRARLSDFGIVRMIGGARMTAANLTLGTASYVAPEQARGGNVGPEADVYALGLVLIEALTGHRCFDGPMHEALAARLTTAPQIPPGLPEPWPGLLAAMTATEPEARPAASEIAATLRSGLSPAGLLAAAAPIPALAGASATAATHAVPPGDPATGATQALAAGAVVPPPATGAVPATQRRRHGALLLLATAALVALLGGAGYLWLTGSSSEPSAPAPVTHTSHAATSPSRHASTSQAVVATHAVTSQRATHHAPPPATRHGNKTSKPAEKSKPQANATPTARTTSTSTAPTSASSTPSTSPTPTTSTPPSSGAAAAP